MPRTAQQSLDVQTLGVTYGCDVARLPSELGARFVELGPDEATRAYLAAAEGRRLGRFRTSLQRVLRLYMSDFDANGLLGAYPMHLLGTAQWQRLFGARPGGRLLDVGAGSGDVSAQLSPLFDEVVATETSRQQARRLRRRGLRCLEIDVATEKIPAVPYDAVACLNVLDRCLRPATLLDRVAGALRPGGALLVALALPYSPAAYAGPYLLEPEERLPCHSEEWEGAVAEFVAHCLAPRNLAVERFTRTPYFAGGDSARRMHAYDDVVFCCRLR